MTNRESAAFDFAERRFLMINHEQGKDDNSNEEYDDGRGGSALCRKRIFSSELFFIV
jgi:hypothetical protein